MSTLDEPDHAILPRPSKIDVPEDVKEAIRTLIRWAGDDPEREGLIETPKRVARAWKEYCEGYADDPAYHLSRIFHEVGGYDEIVLLKDIPFQSHCEHHMAPIIGKAHIAYLPGDNVVGISKLARVLEAFARRLQVQERLTRAGRRLHLAEPEAARRRRRHQGQPRLHDRPRRAHPWHGHDDQPHDGRLQARREEPRRGSCA